MKKGMTLTELAIQIEANKTAKADVVADTRQIAMVTDGDKVCLNVGHGVDGATVSPAHHSLSSPVLPIAHRQIGERVGIPAKYYDRMKTEQPELLAKNVNTWFQAKPENRMVRTMNGDVRAFLSDRYQRIEHEAVAEAVLPVLMEIPGIRIESCEITERRLYIKAVDERTQLEVKKDDVVQAGIEISNSEVGLGALMARMLVFRLWCLNGCTVNDAAFRKHHIGAKQDEGIQDMLTDETKIAVDKAVLLKVRDVVKASLSEAMLAKQVNKMQAALSDAIEQSPVKAVEVLAQAKSFTEGEQDSVLKHLIEGGDLSRYGMLNAVTRASQDLDDYDRATQFEHLGGAILDMERSEWRQIAEAA